MRIRLRSQDGNTQEKLNSRSYNLFDIIPSGEYIIKFNKILFQTNFETTNENDFFMINETENVFKTDITATPPKFSRAYPIEVMYLRELQSFPTLNFEVIQDTKTSNFVRGVFRKLINPITIQLSVTMQKIFNVKNTVEKFGIPNGQTIEQTYYEVVIDDQVEFGPMSPGMDEIKVIWYFDNNVKTIKNKQYSEITRLDRFSKGEQVILSGNTFSINLNSKFKILFVDEFDREVPINQDYEIEFEYEKIVKEIIAIEKPNPKIFQMLMNNEVLQFSNDELEQINRSTPSYIEQAIKSNELYKKIQKLKDNPVHNLARKFYNNFEEEIGDMVIENNYTDDLSLPLEQIKQNFEEYMYNQVINLFIEKFNEYVNYKIPNIINKPSDERVRNFYKKLNELGFIFEIETREKLMENLKKVVDRLPDMKSIRDFIDMAREWLGVNKTASPTNKKLQRIHPGFYVRNNKILKGYREGTRTPYRNIKVQRIKKPIGAVDKSIPPEVFKQEPIETGKRLLDENLALTENAVRTIINVGDFDNKFALSAEMFNRLQDLTRSVGGNLGKQYENAIKDNLSRTNILERLESSGIVFTPDEKEKAIESVKDFKSLMSKIIRIGINENDKIRLLLSDAVNYTYNTNDEIKERYQDTIQEIFKGQTIDELIDSLIIPFDIQTIKLTPEQIRILNNSGNFTQSDLIRIGIIKPKYEKEQTAIDWLYREKLKSDNSRNTYLKDRFMLIKQKIVSTLKEQNYDEQQIDKILADTFIELQSSLLSQTDNFTDYQFQEILNDQLESKTQEVVSIIITDEVIPDK